MLGRKKSHSPSSQELEVARGVKRISTPANLQANVTLAHILHDNNCWQDKTGYKIPRVHEEGTLTSQVIYSETAIPLLNPALQIDKHLCYSSTTLRHADLNLAALMGKRLK